MLPNLPSYAQQIPVQPMNPSVAAQNVAASLGRRQLIASRNEPFGVDKKSAELAEQQVAVSKEGLGLQEAMLKELSQLKEINKKMIIGSVQGTRTSSREASMFDRAQTFASKQKKGGLAAKLAAVAAEGGIKGKLAAGVLRAGSGLKNFGKDIGMGALKTAVGVGGAVGLAKFGPQMLDAMGLKDTLVDEDPNAAAKGILSTSVGSSATGDKERGIFETLSNIDKNLKESFILKNPFEKLKTTLEGGTNLVQEGFDAAKDKIVDGAEKAGNLFDKLKSEGGQYFRSIKENVLQGVTTDQGRQLAMSGTGEKTQMLEHLGGGLTRRNVSKNGALSGAPNLARMLSPEERDKMLQNEIDAFQRKATEMDKLAEDHMAGRKYEDIPESERMQYDDAVAAAEDARKGMSQYQALQKDVKDKGAMPEFREGGYKYDLKENFEMSDGSLSIKQTKVTPFEDDPFGIVKSKLPTESQTMRPTKKSTGEKLKGFFQNLFKSDKQKNKEKLTEKNKETLTNIHMDVSKELSYLTKDLTEEQSKKFQEGILNRIERRSKEPSDLDEKYNKEHKRERLFVQGLVAHVKDPNSKSSTFREGKLVSDKGASSQESVQSDLTSEYEQSGRRSMMSERAQELEDLAKFAEQEGVTNGRLTGEQVTRFYAQRNKRDTLLSDTMENQALKENQQGQTNAPVVLNNTSKTDTTSFTPNATDPRPKNNSFERKINAVADF